MAEKIYVGSLVTAKRDSGVCESGEIGVCYEVCQLGNRSGYGFIFERAGYDGFSPDEVDTFLDVSGRVSKDAASYEFRNVGQLSRDFLAGRFSAAFEEGRELASSNQPFRMEVCKSESDSNRFGVVLRDVREVGIRSMDFLPREGAVGLAHSLGVAEKEISGLFDGEWNRGTWRGAAIDAGKAREYMERNPLGNVFAGAFGQREGDADMAEAWERSAVPQPRDLLKREMLEEAKGRPRDVALEKHGPDIEMDIMRDLEKMREGERQPGRLEWPEAREESTREPQEPDVDLER